MRQLRKTSIIVLFMILLLCSGAYSPTPEDLQARFDEGNSYYLSNQYDKARRQYEGLLDIGYNDPAIYYNLSNTYILLNSPGKAALNLYRAKKLQPRSEDIQKNIAILNEILTGEDDSTRIQSSAGGFKGFIRSLDMMSKNELAVAIFVLYLFFFIWSLARKFMRPGIYKLLSGVLAAISYLFTMVFIVTLLATFYYESFHQQAVVMQTVELRTSPSDDEIYFNEVIVHEGALVEITKIYHSWGEITLGETEKAGWIELKLLEKI